MQVIVLAVSNFSKISASGVLFAIYTWNTKEKYLHNTLFISLKINKSYGIFSLQSPLNEDLDQVEADQGRTFMN